MKRLTRLILLLSVFSGSFCHQTYGQDKESLVHDFNLENLADQPNCEWSEWPGREREMVRFHPRSAQQRLLFPGFESGVNYAEAKYLVLVVEHYNPASTILLIDFLRKDDVPDGAGWIPPRNSTRIGLLPALKTQVIFPLSFLDGQEIFLPRVPRQLKGTFSGDRIQPQAIDQLGLRIEQADRDDYPLAIYISSVRLLKEKPEPLSDHPKAWVDSLGQWMLKEWPGKVNGMDQLAESFEQSLAEFGSANKSEELSDFYGFKELRFDSTGFFHTHFDGRRWWLVDPLGYAYLSIAPTGIGPFSDGPVDGNEDLFSYLPEDEVYRESMGHSRGLRTFSPLTLNLIRLWGGDWKKEWKSAAVAYLNGLGFTGSGNWSDRYFIQDGPFPYVYPMQGFPKTNRTIFRDFPDVYSPEFTRACTRFAEQLIPLQNEGRMIGYFLGNEPHWAFGNFNLAREMMYDGEELISKRKLFSWLMERYGSMDDLNKAWDVTLKVPDDFAKLTFPRDENITETAFEDLSVFSDSLIHQYTRVICDAVKKADPNHLNLGLRFAWISSEACFIAGSYFDVFSLNGYTFPDPPTTSRIREELHKPVILGEFHFGSTDRGLPATGIKGVASEKDRGIAYRRYVEQGFARPEVIGIHYFQWNDQPITGRFDGENYNIGLVDVAFRLYPGFAQAIRKSNSRIFQVATGEKKPFRKKARPVPAIYY